MLVLVLVDQWGSGICQAGGQCQQGSMEAGGAHLDVVIPQETIDLVGLGIVQDLDGGPDEARRQVEGLWPDVLHCLNIYRPIGRIYRLRGLVGREGE